VKRWHLFTDEHVGGAPWRDVEEDPDGEWVKAEDVALAQAVIEALPRCRCGNVATCTDDYLAGGVCYLCDEHAKGADQLPYAEALRAYLAFEAR
jgi:hypothetical protein